MPDQPTVAQCRELLAAAPARSLPALIARFADDSRPGVCAAVEAARRRLDAHRAERRRLSHLARIERELYRQGFSAVAGVDEVGRGALAGPLTVGAVVFAPGTRIEGLDDSKRLTPARREELADEIRTVARTYAVVHVEASEIDAGGITIATRTAVIRALAALDPPADHVVVDGLGVGGLGVPETAVVGGDHLCAAVAAASVIAKVTRDALMRAAEDNHPGYGFAVNKGYGTSDHVTAIGELGLCPLHRRSFSPCGGTLPLF